jgi:hypothetical protein
MAKRADEAATKAARIKLEAELIKAGKSEEEIIATLVGFDVKNKPKAE